MMPRKGSSMLLRLFAVAVLCTSLTTSLDAQVVAKKADDKKEEAKKPADKKTLIKELVKLMEVEKQFTSTNEQLINSFPNPFAQEFGSAQSKFNKIYKESITTTMTAQMKKLSEKLMPKISKLYEADFTAEELQQLVDFYKSPAGVKQQKLAPKMMKETMSVIQSGMENDIATSYDAVLKDALNKAKKQKINPEKVDALIKQHDEMKKAVAAPAA